MFSRSLLSRNICETADFFLKHSADKFSDNIPSKYSLYLYPVGADNVRNYNNKELNWKTEPIKQVSWRLQHFSYHTQSWFDFSQQQLNGFQYSGNWICLQMHLIGTLKLLAQPQGRRWMSKPLCDRAQQTTNAHTGCVEVSDLSGTAFLTKTTSHQVLRWQVITIFSIFTFGLTVKHILPQK